MLCHALTVVRFPSHAPEHIQQFAIRGESMAVSGRDAVHGKVDPAGAGLVGRIQRVQIQLISCDSDGGG